MELPVDIKGLCEYCPYDDELQNARTDYSNQPFFKKTSDGRALIPADMASEEVSELITNPKPVFLEIEEHLEESPCDFIKTGSCQTATFLIKRAVRQPME